MTNLLSAKVAAGWAAAYGTLALAWTVLGRGYPFGPADPQSGAHPLRGLSPGVGAPLFAVVLFLTAVGMLIMAGWADTPSGPARTALLAGGWTVAAVLLVVVPDARLLTLAGYAPALIIGAPFGWPGHVDYGEVFTWALANQVICLAGGVLVAAATLRWQRRTDGRCDSCGRPAARWATPEAAARWGRRFTYVAAAAPYVYAFTRLAWVVGIPLGLPAAADAELRASGAIWAALGLGGFALVGAVLTLGLTQRWGEVFPRWMIGLAGRRVPIALATVPAGLVALFVTSAWIGFFSTPEFYDKLVGEDSVAVAPMVVWPVWGFALGAATLAYRVRRRPACGACGRGGPSRGLVHAAGAEAY